MIDREALAYLVGFFDGEGSVGIYKDGHGNYYCKVSVVNTFLPILKEYKEAFGGSIYKHISKEENHRQAWTWQIAGQSARPFLTTILPLLKEKFGQVQIALDFLDIQVDKELAQRGSIPKEKFYESLALFCKEAKRREYSGEVI